MHVKIGMTAALLSVIGVAASAQQNMDDAVAAAQNQLGVLEYCVAEGHIDGAAVEVQTKIMAMLPPATDTAKVTAAYEAGKAGKISALGIDQELGEAAAAQGAEVAALCTQIADVVKQAGAQLPQ